MATAELTKKLLELADAPPTGVNEEERRALIAACDKAKQALENPLEATVRIMFGGFESTALAIAVNMQLLDIGVKHQGPVTAEQLASESGADVLLVVRVMRMLVAMGIFREAARETYVATPLAGVWITGSPLREGIIHIGSQIPPVTILPEYFETKGYRNPTDAEDGPFQYLHHSKEHFFDWVAQRPKIQHAFNTTMAIQRSQRGEEWFEFYPVQEKLQLAADAAMDPSSAILLVDIGGNVGHDLINFQKRFPDLPGRLIFEDLPAVVASAADVPVGIEGIGHNFFQPHPTTVRGAKAYYLRTILHDWPDKQALQILEQIRPLMRKDSVLLINENALPDEGVALYQAELDLLMMSVFASLDRTVAQFEKLLDQAGFRLVGVWRPKDYVPGSGTLFEALVKE